MSSQQAVRVYSQAPRQDSALDLERETSRIVEAARIVTGATGAVIGIGSETGSLVCRATSGETAPPLGSQFNTESGISGECVRTGKVLVCRDSETDSRVDAQVCRILGVRSIVAVPVSDGGPTLGILEVFSDAVGAFDHRHLEILEQLARSAGAAIVANTVVEEAAAVLPAVASDVPVSSPDPSRADEESAVLQKLRSLTSASFHKQVGLAGLRLRLRVPSGAGLAAIAVLALFSTVFVVKFWRSAASAAPSTAHASAQPKATLAPKPSASELMGSQLKPGQLFNRRQGPDPTRALQNAAAREAISSSPANDANSGVITVSAEPAAHIPAPAATQEPVIAPDVASALAPASSVINPLPSTPASLPSLSLPVSQGVVEGELTHMVQPSYPMWARQRHLEGSVVMRIRIAEDGAVQRVEVLEGDSTLAEAAVLAVRKWRYKPYQLNNHPVATTKNVTVNFKMN